MHSDPSDQQLHTMEEERDHRAGPFQFFIDSERRSLTRLDGIAADVKDLGRNLDKIEAELVALERSLGITK